MANLFEIAIVMCLKRFDKAKGTALPLDRVSFDRIHTDKVARIHLNDNSLGG